jgi:hypothetical protein
MTGMSEETGTTTAPAPTPRVIGSDALAALRERHQKAQGEQIVYEFDGDQYRLLTPMPAAFLIHSGQIQSGDDVDMREFVSAIRSAFVSPDGDKFIDALLDTSRDIPADAEFISQVLSDIVEAVTNRPPSK